MLKMNHELTIGNYTIKGLSAVEIKSSWEDMTDMCKITIPKKLKWKGQPIAWSENPIFKKEDLVTLSLGYDDRLHEVFKGYLTAIHTDRPIILDCQDEMLMLKKNNFQNTYRNVTLSQLLADMLKPIGVKYEVVADYDFGKLRIDNASIAKVLSDLRKDYFLKFFFRDGIFYAGLPYVAKLQSRHVIRFNRHVVEENLEYVRKDDVKINLKCVILYPNGKTKSFEVGDSEGETRTFHKYDIPVEEMKRLAEIEIERLRYDGYRGSLTVFGEPHIKHGDIVQFINDEEPERTGEYLIKRVDVTFSESGYRQIIYPEGRVS